MASSLETNKILAAILTAGIFASGAGVVSRILYHPTMPEEPSYLIDVAAVSEDGGGGEAEAEISLASLLPAADVAAGEKGAKKCAACHTFDEGGADKIGPNLWGILGRDIASTPGFAYSDALTGLEGDWGFDSLDGFLASPKSYASGTKMAYAGMKNGGDRADLILYLRSLAADPLPLPEAEEQESAENVEGEAAEAVEETAETAAEAVDEASTDVAEQASDASEEVVEAIETTAETTSGAVEQVAETAEQAQEVVADEAAEAADAAATAVDEAAETATEAAGDAVESAGDQVAETTEALTDAAGDAAEAASEQVAAITDQAADVVEDATDKAAAVAEQATETVTGAAEAVTAAVGTTVAAVSGAADKAAAGDAGGLVAMIAGADVAAGEKVSKKCKACHVFDEGGKNKLGPALWGVVGRDIASHEGFKFSGALAELEGTWTYAELDQFLAAPKKYVPGTKMVFAGVKKEADRANLIAYLRSLAAEPAPLVDGG